MKGSVTARTTRHLPTGVFMASNIHHFGTLADGRAVQAVTCHASGGPVYDPHAFLSVFQTSRFVVPQPPE